MHGLEPGHLGIWPSASTGGTYCLPLNPHQTNVHISKEEQEKGRTDQTNTAQLLHQEIRHWPVTTKCSHRLLPQHEFSHLFFCSHAQFISHWLRSWGTINQKTNQWRVFSLSSRPPQLPLAPSPRREHINQEAEPSFHHRFRCICWSCWGGFDTFDWLDTF